MHTKLSKHKTLNKFSSCPLLAHIFLTYLCVIHTLSSSNIIPSLPLIFLSSRFNPVYLDTSQCLVIFTLGLFWLLKTLNRSIVSVRYNSILFADVYDSCLFLATNEGGIRNGHQKIKCILPQTLLPSHALVVCHCSVLSNIFVQFIWKNHFFHITNMEEGTSNKYL